MPDPRRTIDRKLRGAWLKEQSFFHGRGLCHVVVWMVGTVVAALLLDWLLDLPGAVRAIVALVALGLVVRVVWKEWWSRLRWFDASRVALEVERAHQGLHSVLISHVQLRGDDGSGSGVSRELLEAMHDDAATTARSVRFASIADFSKLRRVFVVACGAAVVLGVSILFAGEFYRVFVARMLDPTSHVAYPTRTRIVEVTGDLSVRRGDPVELRVLVDGEIPTEGELSVQFERASGEPASPWESVSLTVVEGATGEFRWTTEKSSRSFSWFATVGDATSPIHRVEVVSPPVIIEAKVLLEFPAYTGRAPRELDRLNLEVLEGTKVTWELLCDQELAAAEMLRDDGEPLPLAVDAVDSRRVRVALEPRATFSYRFGWTQRANGFRFAEAAPRSVRVTPDRPPRVEIVSPKTNEKGTRRKELVISFRATDDFDVVDAWIVYSLREQPEERVPIGAATRSEPVVWKPQGEIPDLATGDLLSWAVEVSDSREGPGGAGLGRSRALELEIVSEAEYLEYIEELRSELYSDIKRVLEDESRGLQNVEMLKDRSR